MKVAGACLLFFLLAASSFAQEVEGPDVEPPATEPEAAPGSQASAPATAAAADLIASTSIANIDTNAQEPPPDLNVAVSFSALQDALTSTAEDGTDISSSFSNFAQAVLLPAASNLTGGAAQALQPPEDPEDIVVYVQATPTQVVQQTGTTEDFWAVEDLEDVPASSPTSADASRRRLAAAGRRAMLADEEEAAEEPQLFPVVELLGYGYDIANGRFADSNSMRVQLFQDGWLGDSVAKRTMQQDWLSFEGVTISPILTKYEKITEGSSSRKYRSKLNVNAGLSGTYQGFTGSLDIAFGQEQGSEDNSLYSTRGIVLQTFKIALKSNVVAPDALRRNLDPIFKADLVKLTSDALFEKYGTHFLAAANVGGRYDYSRKAADGAFEKFQDFSTAMSLSVQTVTAGVEAKAGSAGEKFVNTLTTSSTATTITVGGDPSIVSIGDATSEDSEENYKAWIASVQGEAMSLADFPPRGALQPIWQLAATDQRRKDLQLATDQYLTTVTARPGVNGPTPQDRIDTCGNILNRWSKFQPGITWADMSKDDKEEWQDTGCEATQFGKPMCAYLRKRYSIEIGKSWGTLPGNLRSSYRLVSCWEVNPDVKKKGTVSFCANIAMTTPGFRPALDWGSIAPGSRVEWSEQKDPGCDKQMCYFWKQFYGVSPCTTWGELPTYWRESWDKLGCNRADYSKTQLKYPEDKC